jgi:hypothetical protein
LEEGRGWPGSRKFGFRRDEEKFLEVDPEQWPFVLDIHQNYARVCENGQGSLRLLQAHLAENQCPLSVETIRKVLIDPVYETGEWGVTTSDGRYFPGRTIEIPDPIPPELRASNIALLQSTRGRNTVMPVGHFLLNSVRFYHARCMNESRWLEASGNTTPMLRGRVYQDRRRDKLDTYTHVPYTPECCSRYSLAAELVDNVVIEALLALAESEELRSAYVLEANLTGKGGPRTDDLDSLKSKLSILRKNRAKILRDFTDSLATDGTSGVDKVASLIEAIDAEISGLERRVQIVESDSDAGSCFDGEASDLRAALESTLRLGPDSTDADGQKRAMLISALLSKVVVHDTDEGTEIELFGHLIPSGTRFSAGDLRTHMAARTTEVHKPSSKAKAAATLEKVLKAASPIDGSNDD